MVQQLHFSRKLQQHIADHGADMADCNDPPNGDCSAADFTHPGARDSLAAAAAGWRYSAGGPHRTGLATATIIGRSGTGRNTFAGSE